MNRWGIQLSVLASLALFAPVSEAHACSWVWKPGYSPDEIKQRSDMRKVKGIFRWETVAGERFVDEDGAEWVRNAEIHGRIETKRGTGWSTFHEPPIEELTCQIGNYFKPQADAQGTFYISRKKGPDGRYRIWYWEGEHLPFPAEEEEQS